MHAIRELAIYFQISRIYETSDGRRQQTVSRSAVSAPNISRSEPSIAPIRLTMASKSGIFWLELRSSATTLFARLVVGKAS